MNTNVLLLTVDDMNYNSTTLFGCDLPDITPNINCLASQGITLENAPVTLAVCQPSRSVLMTGRYPHRNGARGFECIDESVTTLTEHLHHAGYYNGIIGKEDHLAPREKFFWNEYIQTYNDENDFGRNPACYYEHTKLFLQHAKNQALPFFLMANVHDPHRPYAGSDDEIEFFGRHIAVDYKYTPEEVTIPDFLPDIPDVRTEIAQYYSSVRRCDQSVGEILRALDETGYTQNTIVLFLSDNGMSFPFAKTNCYLNSTKSPWIFRWPAKIKKGIKTSALINGIDYMPTLLDALNLSPADEMDGRSFLPVLLEEQTEHHTTIYTQFYKTSKNPITKKERHYPMRCVQDKRYAYIYNAWPDNETAFINESMAGLSFQAMQEAAKTDTAIAARVKFCQYRTSEEFYDYQDDPDALNNLINVPGCQEKIMSFRHLMQEYLAQTEDELLDCYIGFRREKEQNPSSRRE